LGQLIYISTIEVKVSALSGEWWRQKNLKIDLWVETPSFTNISWKEV
jgi:hypothetical protein